jgi:uncharacterized protein (DUF2252 family)
MVLHRLTKGGNGAEARSRSVDERAADGRALRDVVPRDVHGEWTASPDRRPVVELLTEQEHTRVAELVPLRRERMTSSPFAFYRGAAGVMAADLAGSPDAGLQVQLCGDAHLANFGAFATPERAMAFDINDFDETLPGPFEWDLKRLAASFEIAGRSRGFDDSQRSASVVAMVRSYSEAMRLHARSGNLDVFYDRLTIDDIVERFGSEASETTLARIRKNVSRAQSKDRLKAFSKLTTSTPDGQIRFRSDPPVLVPIDELFSAADRDRVLAAIKGAIGRYRMTLSPERRSLLDRYQFMDVARKVVGVGSVGTRCWVALFIGNGESDPLLIQVKEAEASVLEKHLPRSRRRHHGRRVVEGQRAMQSSSDIFLGWDRIESIDGVARDYYFRQLWDWKGSADLERVEPESLELYGRVCGLVLARGHARTGDPVMISAYLGRGRSMATALAEFSRRYADQNDADHAAVLEAQRDTATG